MRWLDYILICNTTESGIEYPTTDKVTNCRKHLDSGHLLWNRHYNLHIGCMYSLGNSVSDWWDYCLARIDSILKPILRGAKAAWIWKGFPERIQPKWEPHSWLIKCGGKRRERPSQRIAELIKFWDEPSYITQVTPLRYIDDQLNYIFTSQNSGPRQKWLDIRMSSIFILSLLWLKSKVLIYLCCAIFTIALFNSLNIENSTNNFFYSIFSAILFSLFKQVFSLKLYQVLIVFWVFFIQHLYE